MIIKFDGYVRCNEHYWYDDCGNIYIFEDNSKWMIIDGQTKFCNSLMNLETGEIKGDEVNITWVRDELEFKHGRHIKTIGAKDIVFTSINNKSNNKKLIKKINFNITDVNTIGVGDIIVLSDNTKWIICIEYYYGKSYYSATNLETYENSKGYRPISYLLSENFLQGRGIVEVIKSKDILLTYKRRFLKEQK